MNFIELYDHATKARILINVDDIGVIEAEKNEVDKKTYYFSSIFANNIHFYVDESVDEIIAKISKFTEVYTK